MHTKSLLFVLVALPLLADPVPVRYPQGLLHGFLALRSQDGAIIASGDMNQTVKGNQVTNILSFKFKDGSLHEETTIFSQGRTFRLVTYHLVQKGPAFKRPTDMTVNASSGQVNIRYTDDDGKEKTANEKMKLPTDLANGLVTTLLNNIPAGAAKTTVSMVVSTPKARLVKLEISPSGEEPFTAVGASLKAHRYVAKIEIGGISGIIAPIIGKQPPDTHLWMIRDTAPGFLKSEGPLCDGCPIWRIELASPVWP
ncbi:MAG: hypothetical protein ABI972_30220 [Acidobacteriota bacterium]